MGDHSVRYKALFSLVRFMYFGGISSPPGSELGPEDGLEILVLADDYQVSSIAPEDIVPIIRKLTVHNCLNVLNHPALQRYPALLQDVCDFVGQQFLGMLDSFPDKLVKEIPPEHLPLVLKSACHYVTEPKDAQRVVQFSLHVKQLDSACDLLRETKSWNWGGNLTMMRGDTPEDCTEQPSWNLLNVRAAMDSTPARICVGTFFDWKIRLDYGAEGKLRIVYESATHKQHDGEATRCINRFPAAMFAWKVVYKGQDVFNEKPVFICFPENVSLHWSTTLPVTANDLAEDDSLQIMVNMAENPMLSMVLYYFSSDLKNTVFGEDILNRLPHIEYRCLSSYSLVQHHGLQQP